MELQRDAFRELEHLTGDLPPKERAAVVLRYGYDLPYAEIGDRPRLVRGSGARRGVVRRPQTEEGAHHDDCHVRPRCSFPCRRPARPAWSTPATTSSTRRSASCSSPRPIAASAGSRYRLETAEEELARVFGSRVLRSPLDTVRRELDEYFAGRRQAFDLPLDLRVAPFNEQVLHELARVPYGRTETYGGLAAKVGHPRAARAVGTVMNRNPIAIVLPCHRIIGANGSLTGYAGGLDRKRTLLELEGATLPM